mmetsp:Transcript_30120/g.35783  ORF Transcript_30120/g.35783 Transcript_30120/m.35783 type:complete len:80 (+) Transcript_30120:1377-1616(+)
MCTDHYFHDARNTWIRFDIHLFIIDYRCSRSSNVLCETPSSASARCCPLQFYFLTVAVVTLWSYAECKMASNSTPPPSP